MKITMKITMKIFLAFFIDGSYLRVRVRVRVSWIGTAATSLYPILLHRRNRRKTITEITKESNGCWFSGRTNDWPNSQECCLIKPKGQGYSAHRWARTSSHLLLKGWERKSKGLQASARLGPKQLSKRFKSRRKPWYRHLFCDRWASVQAVQLGTELSSKRREKGWSNALSIWHGSLATPIDFASHAPA